MLGNYLLLGLFNSLTCFFAGTVAREAIINGLRLVETSMIYGYQVSVQRHNHHICGGGIIGERFVLTAAHCVINRSRQLRNSNIFILAGTNVLNRTGPPAVKIRVEKVFVSKDFDPQIRTVFVGDIAVLQLANKLTLENEENSAKFGAVRPPRKMKVLHDESEAPVYYLDKFYASGFGWTIKFTNSSGGSNPDGDLRYTAVKLMTDEACEEAFASGVIHTDAHYCTQTIKTFSYHYEKGRFGVCTGDAGGPVVTNSFTAPIVYGILSKVPYDCDEDRNPPVYTRVHHYAKQIHNVMNHGHDTNMISLET